ncbi:hypothetical protein [Aeromicrobium duanguangcaii]|uniref:Uncharacterized protein n=1 Tax=Aeromicrobium duanguangcaii TaxID=2968086 RepID=A0ABY5KKL0_9ACTN|nr:hypothetical protein [Aeromicrobium duanguangcaii]MCD9153341.1 hypothetical protein [Aeromicrobium duanguangcaii]UUI69565.1 hypothetical protein NP095_05575 [Aeromicrobium duanguangcaii]
MASSSIPVADQREAMAQDRDTAREVALEADLSDPARVVDAPGADQLAGVLELAAGGREELGRSVGVMVMGVVMPRDSRLLGRESQSLDRHVGPHE